MGSQETIINFPEIQKEFVLEGLRVSFNNKFLKTVESLATLIKTGKSSIGFLTDHYYYSQQRFILSACLYLTQDTDYKFTIYSHDLSKGYYQTLLKRYPNRTGRKRRIHKITSKIYMVDMGDFTERNKEYVTMVEEPGTIQFWDLPPCEKIQANVENYHDFLNKLDHVSIVSDKDSNSSKDMQKLFKYFRNNNIVFNNNLFNPENHSKIRNILKEIFYRMTS